jgi:hypothetical protein
LSPLSAVGPVLNGKVRLGPQSSANIRSLIQPNVIRSGKR